MMGTSQYAGYFKYLEDVEEAAQRELDRYCAWLDEKRSQTRMSCACKDMRRGIAYPLTARIVELARALNEAKRAA